MFPFQFLKGSYLELIKSVQNGRYIYEEIQFLIDVFTENGYEKKKRWKR